MIKTFEQYNSRQTLDLKTIESYLNNNKMRLVADEVISQLPSSWKLKLLNYFQNETIDIDQLIRYNKKLKIIERASKLYKSGVRNIKDIYHRIIPNNESFMEVAFLLLGLVGIFAAGAALWYFVDLFIEDFSWKTLIIVLALVATSVGGFVGMHTTIHKLDKEKADTKEITVKMKLDQKKHTVLIRMDENGEYTVEEVNEGDW